jgi:hypothetical protein
MDSGDQVRRFWGRGRARRATAPLHRSNILHRKLLYAATASESLSDRRILARDRRARWAREICFHFVANLPAAESKICRHYRYHMFDIKALRGREASPPRPSDATFWARSSNPQQSNLASVRRFTATIGTRNRPINLRSRALAAAAPAAAA